MKYLYKKEEAESGGVDVSSPSKDLIRKAIPMIERGWCRGKRSAKHPDGGKIYCIRGALYEAAGLGSETKKDWGKVTPVDMAEQMILNWIDANDFDVGDREEGIINWNDNEYRTHEQVIEAMKGAAK